MQTKTYTDDRILKITGRMRKVFYVFICIGILGMTHSLLELYESKHSNIMEEIINLIMFLFLYVGLRFRKKLFIPLVLISSAFMFLNAVFHILQPVNNVGALIVKT